MNRHFKKGTNHSREFGGMSGEAHRSMSGSAERALEARKAAELGCDELWTAGLEAGC